VKDAVIETSIKGQGTPIILLAGLGQHMKTLEPLIPFLLESGFKTISINLRGIGRSTGSLDDISLHDLSGDIAGIIEELEIAPAHVIGHAFGNRVARCLASDHPHLVDNIILLAAGGRVPPKPEIREALQKMRVSNLSEHELRELYRQYMLSPSTNPEILDDLPPRQPEVALAHSTAGRAVPVDYWWDAGDAPLLVIQGLDDVVAPPARALNAIRYFTEFFES
jgi:pimeloyl-ACP methyl ester carboxylesterase